eukprot:6866281-Alexandrium_andersonii.AAC.1
MDSRMRVNWPPLVKATADDGRQEQLGGWRPRLQSVAATDALPRAVSHDGGAEGHALAKGLDRSGRRLRPPGTEPLAAATDGTDGASVRRCARRDR